MSGLEMKIGTNRQKEIKNNINIRCALLRNKLKNARRNESNIRELRRILCALNQLILYI